MGSSSSTSNATAKYDTTIVNKSDINVLNESVNNSVSNTVMSQAANCSANISQLQTVDLSNMDIKGDLNIGSIDQKQRAALTFDCVQISKFQNDILDKMVSEYGNALSTKFTTEAQAEISAAASAAAKDKFGSTGAAHSTSNSNIDYKFNQETIENKNIRNIVENSIKNNTSMESVQNCIANVKAAQVVTVAGTKVGKDVNIKAISQDQASTLVAECTQEASSGNKITNGILSELGIKVDDENTTKTITSIKSDARSESTNEGVGDAISGIIDSIGNVLSGLFFGLLSGPIAIAVVCLILCLCCCISSYFMFMSGGSQHGGGINLDYFGEVTTPSIASFITKVK